MQRRGVGRNATINAARLAPEASTPDRELTGSALAAVPAVTSFTPMSGGLGASVTISGSAFTGATKVTIGGAAASSFTVSSDTKITAKVGLDAVSGPIAVTTAGGTGTSATNFVVNPSVQLSRTAAPPGITISVSADAFGSFEAVDVYFDTSDLLLASTDGAGSFRPGR